MSKPRLDTIQQRAKAFAQEMVLFGRLKGSQWDGLAALLVLFAESEIKRLPSVDGPRQETKS